MGQTAYLVLENGKIFKGTSFGVVGDVTAEVVFFTGMAGYCAVLTDKSYYGKIVVQTFPLAGNYGVISSDFEGDIIAPTAYIVKSWCQLPSNFRSEGDLDTFFKQKNIVGLCDIDTRSLTALLREKGTMNGVITQNPSGVDLDALRAFKGVTSLAGVSVTKAQTYTPEKVLARVAVPDYGCKKSIIEKLTRRGCEVVLLPYNCTAEEILSYNPDGILLPGGPGNPNDYTEQVGVIKELIKAGKPIFGIGLGHELLAIANGMTVIRHRHGHHGANHPAKNLHNGTVPITNQSHCFMVDTASIDPSQADVYFVNINDGSCEGIEYKNIPAFSVQFYPESGGGPNNTEWLYDRFILNMQEEETNAAK